MVGLRHDMNNQEIEYIRVVTLIINKCELEKPYTVVHGPFFTKQKETYLLLSDKVMGEIGIILSGVLRLEIDAAILNWAKENLDVKITHITKTFAQQLEMTNAGLF